MAGWFFSSLLLGLRNALAIVRSGLPRLQHVPLAHPQLLQSRPDLLRDKVQHPAVGGAVVHHHVVAVVAGLVAD